MQLRGDGGHPVALLGCAVLGLVRVMRQPGEAMQVVMALGIGIGGGQDGAIATIGPAEGGVPEATA